jgi:hypothetical protein
MSEPNYAVVDFTPDAIQQHYEGHFEREAQVFAMSEEALQEVGKRAKEYFLSDDTIWERYGDALVHALDEHPYEQEATT